jgi:photosystem II stability/assembly factor-like uncharacterized protein
MGNGGVTWKHPYIVPSATCTAIRQAQPSEYGISTRTDAPDEVLVGTNCGIQRSKDGGKNWTAGVGSDKVVWDVAALAGGKTCYACGEEGLLTSSDGQNWKVASQPDPGKIYCRLAVSPDEAKVVFNGHRALLHDPPLQQRLPAFRHGNPRPAFPSILPET